MCSAIKKVIKIDLEDNNIGSGRRGRISGTTWERQPGIGTVETEFYSLIHCTLTGTKSSDSDDDDEDDDDSDDADDVLGKGTCMHSSIVVMSPTLQPAVR